MNQELSNLYDQRGIAPMSRDAEITIYALFPWGHRSQASFSKKAKIRPRTKSAMDELEAAGLIKVQRYKGGSMVAHGTRELMDFKINMQPPTEAESFPITEGK